LLQVYNHGLFVERYFKRNERLRAEEIGTEKKSGLQLLQNRQSLKRRLPPWRSLSPHPTPKALQHPSPPPYIGTISPLLEYSLTTAFYASCVTAQSMGNWHKVTEPPSACLSVQLLIFAIIF
jgi:hypothetical protein